MKARGGGDAQHVAFAGLAQRPLDLTDAVDGVGHHPPERHTSRDGTREASAQVIRANAL
jgi:hypothetical protein